MLKIITSTMLAIVIGLMVISASRNYAAEKLSPAEIKSLARDVYLYAYPIISMDLTMQQCTNVPNATAVPGRAPVNQFGNFREYPKADSREVVRINFDTLYSPAWLDVSQEPMIVSAPNTNGRYYLLPMLDMWTDVFAVVGKRTTGTKAGNYAVVAPGWQGKLPEGITRIEAPTPLVWVIGRTQTNGPADYAAVHKIQDGYKLTPLSAWGKDYKPPAKSSVDAKIDNKTPPKTQVNKLDGVAVFTRLAELMKEYPPHGNDYPILFRMRAIGLEPGKDFDAKKLDPEAVKAINEGAKEALSDMEKSLSSIGKAENGWSFTAENIGTYGTSYRQRAMIAMAGLGANLPEDAVYPTAFASGQGKPLSGANKYVLHFEKGKLPPVDAFWSITMYDEEGFQVANPINRFAIGDRDKLKFNADGSLEIYIQTESPGKDKEANWLPAAKGAMGPTMRLYSPRSEVLDGAWKPPPIERVN
jgi:hypothetical protein